MSEQPAKNHTDLACGQNTNPQLWKGKQKRGQKTNLPFIWGYGK